MTNGEPTAIIFDLWGTLIAPGVDRRDAVSRLMARDLGVDAAAFVAVVPASHAVRFVGATGSLVETLRTLARRCGGDPTDDRLARAAARRLAMTRELLVADDETLAVLDELRGRGLVLGLVTDSSIETPTAWPDSPLAARFGATAFSCLEGVRKPRPEIYLACTRRLGVEPRDCLYVGDGDSRELTGAASLGMTAVRFSGFSGSDGVHYDGDADFNGPEIARLRDLVDLVDGRPGSEVSAGGGTGE
jgi:putative hydrolase of the HAD superfamily